MFTKAEVTEDKTQLSLTQAGSEVQGQLRGVLQVWGDDMRNWCYGMTDNGNGQHCAWGALEKHVGGEVWENPAFLAMDLAAQRMGFEDLIDCSNSGPKNAREMVLRAIDMASTPSPQEM